MYKTIIMPVDVFEMELSDKAIRHAEFLAQQEWRHSSVACTAWVREHESAPLCRRRASL